MMYLVTASLSAAQNWDAQIFAANQHVFPAGTTNWSNPRQMADGRWAIRHPWGDRFITPYGAHPEGTNPPTPLTDSDFPGGQEP